MPSGYFPGNFSAIIENFNSLNSTELQLRVFDLYLVWVGLIASSSGAATIAPDGLGFGQSYLQRKGFLQPSLYQQASSVLFRKAQKEVPAMTGGCVELTPSVTLAGYSEGGLAAFVSGLGLNQMGVQVNAAAIGAPLLDLNFNLGWGNGTCGSSPAELHPWMAHGLTQIRCAQSCFGSRTLLYS